MTTINKDFAKTANGHAAELRKLLDELKAETGAKTPDPSKLRRLAEDIGRQSAEITFNIARAVA